MVLFNKAPVHITLLFLFLFYAGIKIYSQDGNTGSLIYSALEPDISQAPDLVVYPDTVIFNTFSLPIIFDGNHLNLLNTKLIPDCPFTKPLFPPVRFTAHRLFADAKHKNDINRKAYDYIIANNTDRIKYTVADFVGKAEPLEEMPSNIFRFIFKVDNDFMQNTKAEAKPNRFQPKRKYWIFTGNHKIQLSQNYISQNWYMGGVRNLNLFNSHILAFNYKKNRFQNNNTFEWKMNLITNPNDTLRRYNVGEDMVRLFSDFGIQAIHNWFYSSNIEIKTRILNNFIENTSQLVASAFSPLYINVGILGMRYQIEKKDPKIKYKKLNFNTDISPLSGQYITVLNKDVDPARFGIEAGKRHLLNLGSTVNAKLSVNFNKYINFTSRAYYFTNYKYSTAESENTLNLPINRYFSTAFYLYLRYDNNNKVVKNPTWGYFQINELLSFGFNYNW